MSQAEQRSAWLIQHKKYPCEARLRAEGCEGIDFQTHLDISTFSERLSSQTYSPSSSPGRYNGIKVCSSIGLCDSSQGGSFRCVPSCSIGSSTAKPGGSVAISKSTPPGSLK